MSKIGCYMLIFYVIHIKMTTLSENLDIKDNNSRLEKINYYISKLSKKQEEWKLSEKEFILLWKLKEQKNRLLWITVWVDSAVTINESDIWAMDVFLSFLDKVYGGIKDVAFDITLDSVFDLMMWIFED